MFLHRIETPGISHWSYYLEDGGEAVVIDPRLDVGVYTDLARSRAARVVAVVETHRNEDFISGSVELGERTGADVWHADAALDYRYGAPVSPGQLVAFGASELEVVPTPGHTPGHVSYLLHDSGEPWMLFTGDLLFSGAVGRTDLGGPDHADAYARALYHSVVDVVLPLGDHVILWPAHGAGSVCGSGISARAHTTIGLERALDPLLALRENAFVQAVTRSSLAIGRPPYFDRMEAANLAGARMDERGLLPPFTPAHAEEFAAGGGTVLDTRDAECYLTAHVPGSLAIASVMLGAWAGWLLDPDAPVLLVSADPSGDAIELARLGFGDVRGYLGGGMAAWETSGRHVASTHTLDTPGVCHRLDENAVLRVLDVRTAGEVEALAIADSHNVPLNELSGRLDELPDRDPIVVFCGSGRRSTIAASVIERAGRVAEVVLGGTAGWSSARCPLTGSEHRQRD